MEGPEGPTKSTKVFRCQRTKNGLTYSCPVNCEDHPFLRHGGTLESAYQLILDHLNTMHSDPSMQYLIARELHANGKSHFHVYYRICSKMDIMDPLAWDIRGVHPNILAPGKGWIDYCVKKGEYTSNFFQQPLWHRTKDVPVRQALTMYEQEKSEMMALNYTRVEANLKRRREVTSSWQTAALFTDHPHAPEFTLPPPSFCLHVYGLARAGKTQWVLSSLQKLGISFFVASELEDLGLDKPWDEIDAIVFDDVKLSHDLPDTRVIHLLDRDMARRIKIRYGHVSNFHQKYFIFTSNEKDVFYGPNTDVECKAAIDGRLKRVHIPFKLF